MASPEQRAALRRLRRLRRVYHVCFVAVLAAAVGFCATQGGGDSGRLHLGLVAAIVLPFLAGMVAQALVWRTTCPKCHELFFHRSWSPEHTLAGFPTDENCAHCRFNLYRGDNI